MTDFYKMTATEKVNREGQYTVSYNTARGRRKLLFPHKTCYTKQGQGAETFYPSRVSTEVLLALSDFVRVGSRRNHRHES